MFSGEFMSCLSLLPQSNPGNSIRTERGSELHVEGTGACRVVLDLTLSGFARDSPFTGNTPPSQACILTLVLPYSSPLAARIHLVPLRQTKEQKAW